MRVDSATNARTRDWLRRPHTSVLAWWAPYASMVGGLFASVPVRATVWIAALVWMGVACILNAQRCGRTHCRYTGPYHLAMLVPLLLFAASTHSEELSGWFILGAIIFAGSKIIWFATEHVWGKFSS